MYINTGYLNHSHKDFKDKSRPLIVGSCGTYRLSQHPKMPTYRPRGRLDYQIIYISSGLVHFHFDNPENETIIPAGHIVLFRPKELQKYEFYGKDHPWTKKTCLWLKGLPNLVPVEAVEPKGPYCPCGTSANKGNVRNRGAAKRGEDAKNRAKTFHGIARAIAEQFSEYIENEVN